jgi:putative protease
MPNEIELLAPAGTWEALEAAVNAGANAVYLGGKAFGARAYASNFDRKEMEKAVYFCHMHHVRLYVTVNTLVDDKELPELEDYLVFLHNAGVDGIIVQDMGVIRAAQQIVPGLPLHASTQMTVTNSAGVKFAGEHGIVRVVPARELSLSDLDKACATGLEIEAFIHGALCVCYSGQCLMSSLIGGRSGNRGRCAQPCRLPYTLVDKNGKDLLAGKDAGQYLLSPKDLNTLQVLPRMIEAGVVSYKIEGRMKRPEYVAVVVDAYRRAMDSYKAGHYEVPQKDLDNIEQIFNRDFTTAYLEKHQGRLMMSDRRPNNRGVLIGRVQKLNQDHTKAVVKLEKALHTGDGLEFWVKVGGRVGTVVNTMRVNGRVVETAESGTLAEIDVPRGVRLNDRVFRTLDSELMAYAGQFYGEKNKKRIPVTAAVTARMGSPLQVILTDPEGNTGCGVTDFIAEPARKHALDEAAVRKQIDRMGTTEYMLAALKTEIDEGVMVPMSEINEARRKACEALDDARLEAFAPARPKVKNQNTMRRWLAELERMQDHEQIETSQLTVWVDTVDKVKAALEAGADWILFGGDRYSSRDVTFTDYETAAKLTKEAGRHIAFATPRIVKEGQLAFFSKFLQQAEDCGIDLLYVHNSGIWQLAKELELKTPLWADMSLNTYNTQSLQFWKEAGAAGATLSVELNMGQLAHLARVSPLPLECLVQGPIEMMVSEYCAGGSFLGHLDKGVCTFQCKEEIYLHDRKDANFRLAGDQFCRMHVLNSQDLSVLGGLQELRAMGIARLRIDGRTYSPEQVRGLVKKYRETLNFSGETVENLPGTTRGHYYRGVL